MIKKLSDHLGVNAEDLDRLGVFNSVIGVDTKLFIDPNLLESTDIPEFLNAKEKVQTYFQNILVLIQASKEKGDRAWREAWKRLIFRELKGSAIGYGNNNDNGSGIGPFLALKLLSSAKEIIEMGIKDPAIFELLGLFEEDFGADRLSDMTIRIIRSNIYNYTQRVSKELGISLTYILELEGVKYSLPYDKERRTPLIFLPKSLLRRLPIALSWYDISDVVAFNNQLRSKINSIISSAWTGDGKPKKKDLRKIILANPDNLKSILEAYNSTQGVGYNFDIDPASEVTWLEKGVLAAHQNPLELTQTKSPTLNDVYEIVLKIVSQFKRNIEVNGEKEALYTKINGKFKPRHEKFSQLFFFATADTYCEANDLDLSREPNAGNGPVDFKVSKGNKQKVLVELKLSSNKNLVSGMTEQLSAYSESENSNKSIYVIIRVTESTESIERVKLLREKLISEGHHMPELVIIDAIMKPSASKRKFKIS